MLGPIWKALLWLGCFMNNTSKAIIIPSLPICFCFSHPKIQTDLIHKVGNLIASLGSEITWRNIQKKCKNCFNLPNRIKNNSKYSNYTFIYGELGRFIRWDWLFLKSCRYIYKWYTCSYILDHFSIAIWHMDKFDYFSCPWGPARRPTWPGQLLELMVVTVVSSHS